MTAAGGAAAAAAAKRRADNEEEETLTPYSPQDLDGFEFKIVRANTAAFRKPEDLAAVLAEEARFGWEMVEKFDDNRIRLKRRVECRKNDAALGGDPYRTRVGLGDAAMAAALVGGLLAAIALAIGLAVLLASSAHR